jgi:hypothetical protein
MLLWFVFALAVYSILGAFVMKTQNFLSSVVFKAIPFLLGMASLIYVLKIWEVL